MNKDIKGNIWEVDYIRSGFVTYYTSKEDYVDVPVKLVKSRQEAYELAKQLTIKCLKKDNAFEFFEDLHSNYTRFRNYELEDYLNEWSDYEHSYIIEEVCPFNGWSTIKYLA